MPWVYKILYLTSQFPGKSTSKFGVIFNKSVLKSLVPGSKTTCQPTEFIRNTFRIRQFWGHLFTRGGRPGRLRGGTGLALRRRASRVARGGISSLQGGTGPVLCPCRTAGLWYVALELGPPTTTTNKNRRNLRGLLGRAFVFFLFDFLLQKVPRRVAFSKVLWALPAGVWAAWRLVHRVSLWKPGVLRI